MGGNEGTGVKNNTEKSKKMSHAEGLRKNEGDEMRKEKWGCTDTAYIATVVFHSDLSGWSKNIHSGSYRCAFKQQAIKSVL